MEIPTLTECLGPGDRHYQHRGHCDPGTHPAGEAALWGLLQLCTTETPLGKDRHRTHTATPTQCVYTWQKDWVNIWKGDGVQLSLSLSLAFHYVLICGLGFRDESSISHCCVIYCKPTIF